VPDPRTYDQRCGVARSLDVLGERWTLLVVRELLLGPKRFGALRGALPGLGPTLLSQRLARLVDHGVVELTELPPPASVRVYALTARGEALRPAVDALAVWGFPLLAGEPAPSTARGSWMAYTLCAAADAGAARAHDGLVAAFDVDGDRFWIEVADGAARAGHGVPDAPAVRVGATLPGLWTLVRGEEPEEAPPDAVRVEGDAEALRALLEVLRLPPGA